MSASYLLVGMVVSSVGFVLLVYGRRQGRPPHLAGGILLILFPFFVRDAFVLSLLAIAIGTVVWVADRRKSVALLVLDIVSRDSVRTGPLLLLRSGRAPTRVVPQ